MAAAGCAWASAAAWAVLLAASSGWRAVASPSRAAPNIAPRCRLSSTPRISCADSSPTCTLPDPGQRASAAAAHRPVEPRACRPAWPRLVRRFGDRGRHVGRRRGRDNPPLRRGGGLARRAIPFLVLAPGTAWIATSMDGLFAGVVAWGVALVAVSRVQRSTRRVVAVAVAAGLLLGCVPYLSYGLLPVAGLVSQHCTVNLVQRCRSRGSQPHVLGRRRPYGRVRCGRRRIHCRRVLVAGRRAGDPSLLRAQLRFGQPALWLLPAGRSRRVRSHDRAGRSRGPRPHQPATRAAGWLVVAALVAVVVSDLSGVMRGEVERIWLPYAPWVVAAAAALHHVGDGCCCRSQSPSRSKVW